MGWLRQLKESYWQSPQVDLLDEKLEPLRLGDTEAAGQSPIERFVEVERDLGRMTLVTQALIEACVRKGILSHDEIAEIIKDVDLSETADTKWGAAATDRPSLPLALAGNALATKGSSGGNVGVMDDFGDDSPWGNDEEPTEIEGEASTATADDGFDFGGGNLDTSSAIDVGEKKEGVESIPRTAPFPKAKKKPQKNSNMARQMIGVAVSGVVGLVIAYFILLWFFKQDILQDMNMAQKLPSFLVPAEFHSSGSGAAPGKTLEQQLPDTAEKWGDLNQNGGNNNNNNKGKKKKNNNVLTPKATPTPGSSTSTGGFGEGETFAGFGAKEEEPTMLEEPGTGAEDPLSGVDDPLSGLEEPELGIGLDEEVAKVTPKATDDDPLSGLGEEEAPAPTKEPAATEVKTAAPAATGPREMVVKGATPVDGQTLGDAIKEANLASIPLGTGDLTDESTRAAKLGAYKKFAALAQALTFVSGDPEEGQLASRIPTAEDVAKKAVSEEKIFEDVATIGHQWIDVSAKNRGTDGVFLTGKVQDVQSAGQYKSVTLDMGKSRTANVIVSFETDVVITDRVAVLGVIVDNPEEKLPGYENESITAEGEKKSPVVWSEHIMMVENPLPALE